MTIFMWRGILRRHFYLSLIMEVICMFDLGVHMKYNSGYLDTNDKTLALLVFTDKCI